MSELLPRPTPRDAFRRALRSRLMAEAVALHAPRETTWTRFQRLWLRPALGVGVAAVLILSLAGSAAANSLPGDPAFGLKRAIESVQLALTFDDNAKLKLLAEQAERRLTELSTLAAQRAASAPAASAEYTNAVDRFNDAIDALRGKPDADEDKRSEAEEVANAARARHEAILDQLEQTAPAGSAPEIEHARNDAANIHASDHTGSTPTPQNNGSNGNGQGGGKPSSVPTPRR